MRMQYVKCIIVFARTHAHSHTRTRDIFYVQMVSPAGYIKLWSLEASLWDANTDEGAFSFSSFGPIVLIWYP